MPVCRRNSGYRRNNGTIIITDRRDCGAAPETIVEELYNAPNNSRLILKCCDSICGYREADARRRCRYWPGFAHPRWLSCRELNNCRIF